MTTDLESSFTITDEFVRLVENKGYSMFHLIENADYLSGLAALKRDYAARTPLTSTHGETLSWTPLTGSAG